MEEAKIKKRAFLLSKHAQNAAAIVTVAAVAAAAAAAAAEAIATAQAACGSLFTFLRSTDKRLYERACDVAAFCMQK